MTLALVALCLACPAAALWAAERFAPAKLLGPVVLCYLAGIAVANVPGLPLDAKVSLAVSEAAVPLALPLLLFSADVRKWLGLARPLLVSFALACLAAVLAAGVVGLAFRGRSDEWWKIAGMLVGVYVGGTANMSAIGLSLGVRQETFALLNAADVIAGGAYLLFLLTFAQRLLLRFMRPFSAAPHPAAFARPGEKLSVWTRRHLPAMGTGLGLSLAIGAASVGLSFAVYGALRPALVVLTITSLALGASFLPRIRALEGPFELGEYVLLVFCVAVGSMADVRLLQGASATLFLFVCGTMLLAIVLHVALCAAFRIDADTTLMSSTATIYGPAFVGPVAAALKNRELVGPGITMGLAGLALGTYGGLFTAWTLRWLAGG